ncbi:MAG: hypothetical protein HY013_01980, partial [Candidatus Solibacter usitatus]|nr:hypothetical protein [Candidatus Solibacter usitatus]
MKLTTLAALAATATLAPAQQPQQAQTQWAHVDFIRTTEGKGAEFAKTSAEKIKPAHQERVNSGKEYAYVVYRPLFPHGSSVEADRIRIAILNDYAAVDETTGQLGTPRGLYRTVSGELWRVAAAYNPSVLVQAEFLVASFYKLKPGRTSAEFQRFLRDESAQPRGPNPSSAGQIYFARVYPGGESAEYTHVQLRRVAGFTGAPPTNQAPPDLLLFISRRNEYVTTVRTEMWR